MLTGDWTAVEMGRASERLAEALGEVEPATIDLSRIGRCDTSGAHGVLRAARLSHEEDRIVASPEVQRLLRMVAELVICWAACPGMPPQWHKP